MTEDITSLQIRILYDSVTEAERRLRELERQGRRTGEGLRGQESAAGSLMKKLLGLAAAYVTVRGVIAGFQAVIKKTAEFQQLNAQLVTATGSAEKAKIAFAAIKDFAASTPYDLQQATGAFISLVNRGLDPSERALKSYGDTASSMGFQLSEMVLAVSNATAGEYENLKRFGIRAAKEGENVKFTFRGVTETVKNDINSIESYFIKLGEKSFAGGMERQMQTLTGAMSNMGDAYEILLNAIGEQGLGEMVEGGIRSATAALAELTAMFESGQIQASIDSWGIAFSGYVGDVSAGVNYLNEILTGHGKQGEETGMTLAEGLLGGMRAVVIGYRAYVQTVGTVLFGIVDSAAQVAEAVYETFAASFNALLAAAYNVGRGMANALNPFSTQAPGQSIAEGFAAAAGNITAAGETARKSWDQSIAKIGINADVVASGVADAWKGAGDDINAATMKIAEADQKRAEYDKGAAARAKDTADRLAQFAIKPKGGASGASTKPKGGGGGGGSGSSEWENLERSLQEQETLIADSYDRRFALIEANTRNGSLYQAELEISLTEKVQAETNKRIELLKKEPETMLEGFALEEKTIEDSYARRKKIILEATEATEAEKLKMLGEAELQHTAQMRKFETERNKMQFGLAADFFGNLATMAGAFGKRGTKIAKAAAIAQTTIKTYESATSAYAALAGIPYIGPALGAAAAGAAIAAGFANVQAIKAQDDSGGYSGTYATGGFIPAGKFGIAGETGPEFVQGPAMVTSASSTADRLANPGGGGGANVEVNIVNMSGEPVTEKRSQSGDKQLIEFIIGQAKQGIAEDIQKGGTGVAKALERTYGMGRGRRQA